MENPSIRIGDLTITGADAIAMRAILERAAERRDAKNTPTFTEQFNQDVATLADWMSERFPDETYRRMVLHCAWKRSF